MKQPRGPEMKSMDHTEFTLHVAGYIGLNLRVIHSNYVYL